MDAEDKMFKSFGEFANEAFQKPEDSTGGMVKNTLDNRVTNPDEVVSAVKDFHDALIKTINDQEGKDASDTLGVMLDEGAAVDTSKREKSPISVSVQWFENLEIDAETMKDYIISAADRSGAFPPPTKFDVDTRDMQKNTILFDLDVEKSFKKYKMYVNG